VGTALMNLGLATVQSGDVEAAVAPLEEALRIFRETRDPHSVEIATAAGNLASVYVDLGRPDRAKPLLKEAEAIWIEQLGEDVDRVRLIREELARIDGKLGTAAANAKRP
jgi:tetratricopeptide (TPR) repeat protein